jgi:hypothetical protein
MLTRKLWHSTDLLNGAHAECGCPAIHKGKSPVNKLGFFFDHTAARAAVLGSVLLAGEP